MHMQKNVKTELPVQVRRRFKSSVSLAGLATLASEASLASLAGLATHEGLRAGLASQANLASLADLPGPVDMVDYFRKPEFLPDFADEVLAMPILPKVVWMQLGISDDEVAAKLEVAGISVVQNRCPKIEYARLCGEIAWCGYNRRTISSKKPKLKPGYQHFTIGEPGF